ncbi:MAG: methyltransferase domain-containing protein [Sphingobium sp.]|nr:methyltransferase domain-containing protein [Sphingobium sp.]
MGHEVASGMWQTIHPRLRARRCHRVSARRSRAGRLDLSCFEPNSCDLIYACHIVEHFPRQALAKVLEEWKRVLRPGTLRIAVPDFERTICEVYGGTKQLGLVIGPLYGG